MKAFIIRDKHGKLYMSLKTFSKKNGDWIGSGFIELNDEDVENSEMIKFSDDSPTVVDITFCSPVDCLKNETEKETDVTDKDVDKDNENIISDEKSETNDES